jgi:tetratricopeptide (TPR) repeat protein
MRLFFFVFITVFGFQTLQGQLSYTLDSIIRVGYLNIEKEKYDQAIREFNKVLGVQSNNIQATGGKIFANIAAERLRESQRQIDESLKRFPAEPEFIFWRGVLSNARKQYQKAIEDFEISLSLNPQSNVLISRIYQNKAASLSNLNESLEAFENIDKALLANPMNIGAFNLRGLILYRSENYREALVDFERITEIDPTNDIAIYNQAMSYLRMQDKQKACIHFHKACGFGNRNACQMIFMECQ